MSKYFYKTVILLTAVVFLSFGVSIAKADAASISVNKSATPNNPATFSFKVTGPGYSNFNIPVDNSGFGNNTRVGLSAGTYTITEDITSTPGWTLNAISCAGAPYNPSGINGVSVTFSTGLETFVCTFQNTKDTTPPPPSGVAYLEVRKELIPSTDTGRFNLKIGLGPATGTGINVGDGGTTGLRPVLAGFLIFVGEEASTGTNLSDYTTTISCGVNVINATSTSVKLLLNQTMICIITNTKITPPSTTGNIKIIKNVYPTGVTGTFGFDISPGTFSTAYVTPSLLGQGISPLIPVFAPGKYDITEAVIPSGWVFTSVSCKTNNGSGGITGTPTGVGIIDVTVNPGDTTVCTFENQQQATLIVKKKMIGGVGVFNFIGTPIGAPNGAISVNDGTITTKVTPGITYTSTEAVKGGWKLDSIVCNTGGTTDLPNRRAIFTPIAGQTITCTFTNEAYGILKIVKNIFGGDGKTIFEYDINPTVSVLQLMPPANGQDSDLVNLSPDTYDIVEQVPSGWTPADVICTKQDGTSTGTKIGNDIIFTVEVEPGKTTTCEFDNEEKGTIIIDKVTIGTGTAIFPFTSNAPGYGNFTIDTAVKKSYALTVSAGLYTIIEGATTGWTFTSAICMKNNGTGPDTGLVLFSSVIGIVVDPGETVICTFTNTKLGGPPPPPPVDGIIIVNKITNVPDPAVFHFHSNATGYFNFDINTAIKTSYPLIVPAGVPITITEDNTTPGWTQNSNTCLPSITVAAGGIVPCFVTNIKNPPPSTLEIVKEANAGGTFPYAITPTSGGPNLSIPAITIPSGGGSDSKSASVTLTTTYTYYDITETIPADWFVDSIICSVPGHPNVTVVGGNTIKDVILWQGLKTTCKFINVKNSTPPNTNLKIDKICSPSSDTGKFNLKSDGLTYGSDILCGGTTNSFAVTSGAHTVSETAGTGTNLNDYTISYGGDCNSAGNITVLAGQSKICTITNTRKGPPPPPTVELTIIKNTIGGDGSFTFTGNTTVTSLTTVGGTISQTVNLAPGATYTIQENVPSGWTLTNPVSCTSSGTSITNGVTINIAPISPAITCTFTNTKIVPPGSGTLKIIKNTIGGDDKFGFNVSPSPLATIYITTTSSTGNNSVVLASGNYYISESFWNSGWVPSSPVQCKKQDGTPTGTPIGNQDISNVEIRSSETTVCTFTDTKTLVLPKIKVDKVLIPSTDPGKFNLKVGGATYVFNVGNGGTTGAQQVAVGTYIISETAGTSTNLNDYTTVVGGDCSLTGSITLASGDNKVCTITNTKKVTTTLTVKKVLVPSTSNTDKFNLQIDGTTAGTGANVGNNGTTGAVTVTAGAHTVKETAGTATTLSDYDVVTSGDCSASGDVTLAVGDNKTCTITNTKKPVIIVKKVMVGGTDTFDFNGDPDGSISVDKGTIKKTVAPGTYTSTEDTVTDWDLTSITCDDPDSTGDVSTREANFDVAAGQTVTCTFTNTKQGTLKVVKNITGGDGTTQFDYSVSPTPSMLHITPPADGQAEDSIPVTAGKYDVLENVPTGWTLDSKSCADGSGSSTGIDAVNGVTDVTIIAGQTTTCTFDNTEVSGPVAGTLIIEKNTIGGEGTFNFEISTTPITNKSITTVGGTGKSAPQSLPPGKYSVTELVAPANWGLTKASCSDTTSHYTSKGTIADVTVAAGQTTTCTFENALGGASGGGSGRYEFEPILPQR